MRQLERRRKSLPVSLNVVEDEKEDLVWKRVEWLETSLEGVESNETLHCLLIDASRVYSLLRPLEELTGLVWQTEVEGGVGGSDEVLLASAASVQRLVSSSSSLC